VDVGWIFLGFPRKMELELGAMACIHIVGSRPSLELEDRRSVFGECVALSY
jgi:hypothetical protein